MSAYKLPRGICTVCQTEHAMSRRGDHFVMYAHNATDPAHRRHPGNGWSGHHCRGSYHPPLIVVAPEVPPLRIELELHPDGRVTWRAR